MGQGQSTNKAARAEIARAIDVFANEVYANTLLQQAAAKVIAPPETVMTNLRRALQQGSDVVKIAVVAKVLPEHAQVANQSPAKDIAARVIKTVDSIQKRKGGMGQDLPLARFVIDNLDEAMQQE